MQNTLEPERSMMYDELQEKCVKHSSRQPDIEGDK